MKNNVIKEAANISPRELKRLKRIQAIESKNIRVSIKKIQRNAFPYFLKGGTRTFKIKGDPKTADGLYGEESYIAIFRLQSDLFNKGFLLSLKRSGRMSTEGVYGKETHDAFLKAQRIGAILGFEEPEKEEEIRKRIEQLKNFIKNEAENEKQIKWARNVIALLMQRLKPNKEKDKAMALSAADKAVKRDEIMPDQKIDWARWIMTQIAAGNIVADHVSGRFKVVDREKMKQVTAAAIKKKQDLAKKAKKQDKRIQESRIYEIFNEYFAKNNKKIVILTEKNYNCEKLFLKACKIFNFEEKN